MSVKPLSIAEWGNTVMIEPVARWWKTVHLQYYELGVCGDTPGRQKSQAGNS